VVKVLMVDVIMVGIGGGFIVWVLLEGMLKVGLCFVGVSLGLVCYFGGGLEFMMIDVFLFFGYILEYLFGGEILLCCDVVREVYEGLVEVVGLGFEVCVVGVFEIVVWN